ncbi:hypothetical protein CR513_50098, partial [Mucuna pruriens]
MRLHTRTVAFLQVRRIYIRCVVTTLVFKEGTSLSDHLNEFQGILDQMSGMGIKFEDEILGLLLLNSLPEFKRLLREVKHVPDVRFNLTSMHMLDDGGYDNHFGYEKWKLTKGNLVMVKREKISKLYWTTTLVAKDSVNVMDMKTSLWHRRLSHISEKGLNCLTKRDMLSGLKNVEMEKCSHYMVVIPYEFLHVIEIYICCVDTTMVAHY